MVSMDDSESNAKVMDSAYSTSCSNSNSQSRRSHSSKSTRSESNSSGSSGYGGKPSNLGSSSSNQPKKKPLAEPLTKTQHVEKEFSCVQPIVVDFKTPLLLGIDAVHTSMPVLGESSLSPEIVDMDISNSERNSDDEIANSYAPLVTTSVNSVGGKNKSEFGKVLTLPEFSSDGFSCVISMQDGVVIYTTTTLTTSLGYPVNMWIGRSLIDFIHKKDRSTFVSQITNGLASPKVVHALPTGHVTNPTTMVCRIRKYRGLTTGFGVRERSWIYLPFLLKFTFRNVSDENGKVTYMVIQASQFRSAFKSPYESVTNEPSFFMRHSANGILEYIDSKSVPYLGYLPQDLIDKNVLEMYHPEDLDYLSQIYDRIVREGASPRSKQYRLETQNGFFIKVETEFTSFINPWSRKLEFVTGKHHVMEGPAKADVFALPNTKDMDKYTSEEQAKLIEKRNHIIRSMNQISSKPAETVKQHMSKRCQDVASFMESLLEELPKPPEEDLRLDLQDADQSFERDSVMLGGISPHHDSSESKSGSETPLSYTQLNYNQNLQRYFDSHQSSVYQDYNTAEGLNILGLNGPNQIISNNIVPKAQVPPIYVDTMGLYAANLVLAHPSTVIQQPVPEGPRLTTTRLRKHNVDMEKTFMKMHKEIRSTTKGEREKASNEKRKNKKEHLARCNASFQSTDAGQAFLEPTPVKNKPRGVKRSMKQRHSEGVSKKKQRPGTFQQFRGHPSTRDVTPTASNVTTSIAQPWQQPTPISGNNLNTYVIGMPNQMPVMSPVTTMPGVTGLYPMYYGNTAPNAMQTPVVSSPLHHNFPQQPNQALQSQAMQCMMYGQAMNGTPFMYSHIGQPMSFPLQGAALHLHGNHVNLYNLPERNYAEVCYTNMPTCTRMVENRGTNTSNSQTSSSKNDLGSGTSQSSNAYTQDMEGVQDKATSSEDKSKTDQLGNSGKDSVDKTDGVSSCSSFYSSFFRTEADSTEDSSDAKKKARESNNALYWERNNSGDNAVSGHNSTGENNTFLQPQPKNTKKVFKRKLEAPWTEQVCVTSELIYKYQIRSRSTDEILKADKEKLKTFKQPNLVNEQLSQLYMDLQLEGVAARLTLEEGITSSSSSGEETSRSDSKFRREYSKLVMVFEENTPLPPPPSDGEKPSTSC